MKKSILPLLLIAFVSQAQVSELVYSVPVNADTHGHTDGIISEDSLLYVLTEHHVHVLSYDCDAKETEIHEIMPIDESLFIVDLFLTDDWFYFVMHGKRSIQRMNRNDPNQGLEVIADNLTFPTALSATETKVYYADYGQAAIYGIDLNGTTQTPELIIEDSRLYYNDVFKMALIDSFLYAVGDEVLFKINTTDDVVEAIPMPGLKIGFAVVSIGENKLLAKSNTDLYVIDLSDNSYFFIGALDCSGNDFTCLGIEFTIIGDAIFITQQESPDVVKLWLPNTLFADMDNDKFGDLANTLEIVNNDFQKGFVFSSSDCDDGNSQINPSQTEVPYNGLDDDCNPLTIDDDLDQDGYGLVDDCDDQDSEINPMAIEIPNNGIDEDCDGLDITTSTHELANSILNIYPNPVVDEINIEFIGEIQFMVSIYSLAGELILVSENEKVISFNSIPRGTYLMEVKELESGNTIVEKIVVGK